MSLVNALFLDAFYSIELTQEKYEGPERKRLSEEQEHKIAQARRYFHASISKLVWRIGISTEEYVLLKSNHLFQLRFENEQNCNNWISVQNLYVTGKSVGDMDLEDKELLRTEEERFTKMLMFISKVNGPAAGAKKFAELMSLINLLFKVSHRIREFHAMIFTVLQLEDVFAPFFSFCYVYIKIVNSLICEICENWHLSVVK
uniref:Uncharacterized protein n=1 Tax=Ditylenchus dipsaci TaxID=166011 RepID=A0A915CL81_9BILA